MKNRIFKSIFLLYILFFFYIKGNFIFSQDYINRGRIYTPNDQSRSYLLKDNIPAEDTKMWFIKPNFEDTNINILTEQELYNSNIMKNWSCDNSDNNYYNENIIFLRTLGYSKSEIRSYKFNTFPITYNLLPTNSLRNMIIRKALQEMSFYFSMKETNIPKEADLIIEVIDSAEKSTKCPKENIEAFGCGFNSYNKQSKPAYIAIVKSAFRQNNIKGIVLHFFGHAFGIAVHSKNPTDLMYKDQMFQNSSSDIDDEDSFSVRDLNTFYKIYNSPLN